MEMKKVTNLVEQALALIDERKFAELHALIHEENAADINEIIDEVTPEQGVIIYRLLPKELAAEVFVEVGLAVKKTSPFAMTMLSCLTGGSSQRYICSHYAYEAMYYEPSESLYGEGTAEELTEVLKTELQKLDQEGAAVEAR